MSREVRYAGKLWSEPKSSKNRGRDRLSHNLCNQTYSQSWPETCRPHSVSLLLRIASDYFASNGSSCTSRLPLQSSQNLYYRAGLPPTWQHMVDQTFHQKSRWLIAQICRFSLEAADLQTPLLSRTAKASERSGYPIWFLSATEMIRSCPTTDGRNHFVVRTGPEEIHLPECSHS